MLLTLARIGVPIAALACGAAVRAGSDAGNRVDGAEEDASSGDRPSIVGSNATPPPAVCIACSANDNCGEAGTACVVRDAGGSYCAPGCNKEGYCTPDRVCTRVSDATGLAWAACVPIGGCSAMR